MSLISEWNTAVLTSSRRIPYKLNTAMKKKAFQLLDYWSLISRNNKGDCPVCTRIYISTQVDVPEFLRLLENGISVGQDIILHCPRCGQLYQYRTWMSSPDWVEAMEGITEPYEVEILYKRSMAEVRELPNRTIDSDPSMVKLM